MVRDQMNLKLDGTNFTKNVDPNRSSDYMNLADDGLILINIEKKSERLRYMKEFAFEFKLEPEESALFFKDISIQLNLALSVRRYQENLKQNHNSAVRSDLAHDLIKLSLSWAAENLQGHNIESL
jgi:hypothetical protein